MKPIVKYVGGKSWLRNQLRETIKKINESGDFDSYGEAFVGAGGSFFAIHDLLRVPTVHLNDISVPITSMYADVLTNSDELLDEYSIIEQNFAMVCKGLSKNSSKSDQSDACAFFGEIKKQFNELKATPSTNLSARFIFLQQHSFNGIYRENKKGMYNTPYNWNPTPFSVEEIAHRVRDVQKVFANFDSVTISNKDVFELDCSNGLWYFDPPYIDDGSGMNAYNKQVFNLARHINLAEKVNNCHHFIYSNHPNAEIQQKLHSCETVEVHRTNIMSSDPSARSDRRTEILIFK